MRRLRPRIPKGTMKNEMGDEASSDPCDFCFAYYCDSSKMSHNDIQRVKRSKEAGVCLLRRQGKCQL